MGCCGSKKGKNKLQEHGIVDERTKINFGLINNQSNTESEGMGVVEVIELVSFAAIFILVLKCFYQHCGILFKKMSGRQQRIVREAVEMGTRSNSVAIPMPAPVVAPPIYSQPTTTTPSRPAKGYLPGYTDYSTS